MKKLLILLLVTISTLFSASTQQWLFPVATPVYVGGKILCTDWWSNKREENGKTYDYQAVNYPCKYGTVLVAPFDGLVTHTQIDGYEGAAITIRDDVTEREITICHLSRYLVLDNWRVSKGTPIARSGKSGRTTGPHVRIRVDKDGVRQFINAETWGKKYDDFIYSSAKFDVKKAAMYRK